MRTVMALFLVALLSGCLSQASDDDEPAPVVEAPATPTASQFGVELFNQPYQAVPGQSATFLVDVPEGAVNVQFKLGTKVAAPGAGATLAMDGCGESSVTWSGIGIAGGNNWQGGSLCDSAKAGAHELKVDATALPLAGDLVVVADIL